MSIGCNRMRFACNSMHLRVTSLHPTCTWLRGGCNGKSAENSPDQFPGPGYSDCQKSLAEFAPAGANKVKIIFSGGKWVRLQERKRSAARLAKSNPCSAYVGEILLALQVWNFCAESAEIMRAAGCKPLQMRAQRSGKRESKS